MNALARFEVSPETGPPESFTAEEEQAIAAVFDFSYLVLLGLQGEREARRLIVDDLGKLVKEENWYVIYVLAKYGLQEARAILCPNND